MDKFTQSDVIGISIIQFISGLIFLRISGHKFFSFAVLFNILIYTFHGGQLFLEFFRIDAERPFDIFSLVDNDVRLQALNVFICSQFFLILAFVITKKSMKSDEQSNKVSSTNSEQNLSIVYQIGNLFFLIGLIPRVYVDGRQFIAFFNGGYLATYSVITNNYITLLAYFFQVGVVLMIIGACKNKQKAFKIAMFASIYLAITMAKGGRGTQVVSIITIWFVYFKVVSQLSKQIVAKIAIISYGALCALSVVGNIRNQGVSGYNDLGDLLIKSMSLQTLWDSLGEFGGSAISLCYSVHYFPEYTPYLHGLTYLTSALILFPNTSGIFGSLTKYWTFVSFFPSNARFALGGSIYGELYANFGFLGTVISSFIFGIILGKYSNGIDEACDNGKWKHLAVEMMLFPFLLMWVRGYFADTLRQFVYSAILFFILYQVITKKRGKNEN